MEFLGQTVPERIAELERRLATIPDPQARLGWLVERARTRPSLPAVDRMDQHLVPGCRVRTWWVPSWRDGRCRFGGDSDAVTLKAFTTLLSDLCDGAEPDEILGADFSFLEGSGLLRHLTDSRRATAIRIVESARTFAEACRTGGGAGAGRAV